MLVANVAGVAAVAAAAATALAAAALAVAVCLGLVLRTWQRISGITIEI